MSAGVDAEFIRRAVGYADLDAVRVALYQQTGDPVLRELPVAGKLGDADRELLVGKAVGWLLENAGPGMPTEPAEEELRDLINLATGEKVSDFEFDFRRDIPSFKDFPWTAGWTGGRPELPEGFLVAIIGSGFSGIAAGVQMELLGIPYVVLERRGEAGGTWSINRYPDIRVDTPSVSYEFSFEHGYPWTEYFARGAEVRAYLQHVAEKYGVRARTRFSRELRRAAFDEARNTWRLELDAPDGREELEANFLITAVGTFANPKFPDFEGQESFRGTVVHPSRWPGDLELAGRKVAVVGNGSTGVQLLSAVADQAESVGVFQRTPQWISPRQDYARAVEPETRWLLDNLPGYWNWARYLAIAPEFRMYQLFTVDEEWKANGGLVNPMSDRLRARMVAYIREQTGGRADLIDRLIPAYAPFIRRPVVDNGWYKALTRDNVRLVTSPITRLTPVGIETADGTVRDADVIIVATGYEVRQYLWPMEFAGRNGIKLHDFWADDGARAYIGMMVPGFPNMFMLYGPNSQPLHNGNGLPAWYVIWSAYAARCMVRMIEEGKSRVEVRQEAYARYNKELDEQANTMLLMQADGAPEKNYYVDQEHGRLQVNAPWSGPDYHRLCTRTNWADIEIS